MSAVLAVLAASCGGGSTRATGGGVARPQGLRIEGTAAAGGDALAAELLVSGGFVLPDGRPAFAMASGDLADEVVFRARAHLEAMALGAAQGPLLEGSVRIRRLAALATAPKDRNGNGTNLDETLARDLDLLHDWSGGEAPAGIRAVVFPWSEPRAELATPQRRYAREAHAEHRTRAPAEPRLSLEAIGAAIRARALAAGRLLSRSRGSLHGETAPEGMRGLLYLQQAVAAEETLLGAMFHDGRTLQALRDPKGYDPKQGVRWPSAEATVREDPDLRGAPAGYDVFDRAETLSGLAAVLEGAAELAWLASASNPYPNLRDALRGRPFGTPPDRRQGRLMRPDLGRVAGAGGAEVTWDEDIGPLLRFHCSGCHSGKDPIRDFSIDSYELVLRGGVNRAKHPTVVKGDHTKSLLWQVLVGDTPVSVRMPFGLPPLSPGEISLVADWIDAGAPKSPSAPRPAPEIGLDLARVLVRNLEALHLDPATGGLHERHEGDAPSGLATARATGDALVALAAYARVARGDDLRRARDLLDRAAAFAATRLVTAEGAAHRAFDLAAGAPLPGLADLHGHARLTGGLLAAGRVLGDAAAKRAGRALARVLLGELRDAATGAFVTHRGRPGRRYTAASIAAVLHALREVAADGAIAGAVVAHDAFLRYLRPRLAFAEWDGRGEVLGDGIPDTDHDGIPEPALAGSEHGMLPLLAGVILDGPDPTLEVRPGPVTWSRHVRPLFRRTCAECHLDGRARIANRYRLDTPRLARQPGESNGVMPLIVPGDPEGSLLYRKLVDRRPIVGAQMPLLRPPLDARGKELVRRWIAEGARGW